MRRDTKPDVIARFSIGAEACDDNIGSVCVANRGDGFLVFINGGVLPQGESERFFPASSIRCLADAYAFALSIAQGLIEEEVQIGSMVESMLREENKTPTHEEADDLTPKFPDIHVQLSGEDGNVFSIIGRVQRALRQGGANEDEIKAFGQQVQAAGSYAEVLHIVARWVETS